MKVRITKLGRFYTPKGIHPWANSHAQVPFAYTQQMENIRVYFSTRDVQGRSGVSYIELDKNNPKTILYEHDELCFKHSNTGFFDDNGTMPSWFLPVNDEIWMYYTGWNACDIVGYRLSIGLAFSTDGGKTFHRRYTGPILDRGQFDPVWVAQPAIFRENDQWRMWYLSCQKLDSINNKFEHCYTVKYAESEDGIHWDRPNITCIDLDEDTDAIGRPFVWKYRQTYFMMHSNRKSIGFRNDSKGGYRLQLSTSKDGIYWEPVNDFNVPKDEDWDSIMNEYSSVIPLKEDGKFLVFYNGNGFGRTGFGAFELKIEFPDI